MVLPKPEPLLALARLITSFLSDSSIIDPRTKITNLTTLTFCSYHIHRDGVIRQFIRREVRRWRLQRVRQARGPALLSTLASSQAEGEAAKASHCDAGMHGGAPRLLLRWHPVVGPAFRPQGRGGGLSRPELDHVLGTYRPHSLGTVLLCCFVLCCAVLSRPASQPNRQTDRHTTLQQHAAR